MWRCLHLRVIPLSKANPVPPPAGKADEECGADRKMDILVPGGFDPATNGAERKVEKPGNLVNDILRRQ